MKERQMKKLDDVLNRLEETFESRMAEEASRDSDKGEKPPGEAEGGSRDSELPEASGVVLEFPSQWDEDDRAVPNAIARSALFAPIRRGRRPLHEKALIASRGDVEIRYTGRQLDMADQDVWLALIEIARKHPIGVRIKVSRYEILRLLGRRTGKADYLWLHEAIWRLKTGTVEIKAKRYRVGLSFVEYFELDDKTGEYYMRLNPEVAKLYARSEYALVNWERRKALKGHVDLAKWLQGYAASHKRGEEHRIGIGLLKTWAGYTGELNDFRAGLRGALRELERIGEIENIQFEGEIVAWKRP